MLVSVTSWFSRLTAFVLKSFAQSRGFIFIDPEELRAAKSWLITHQKEEGSFPAVGRILNKDLQVHKLRHSFCLTLRSLEYLWDLSEMGELGKVHMEICALAHLICEGLDISFYKKDSLDQDTFTFDPF